MSQQGNLHKLVIGAAANGNLITTEPRRNLLILGPPRSAKTAGVLIPAILSHPGPLVSTSTKADVLRATGLVRAPLGRVWHYGPDGGRRRLVARSCAGLRSGPRSSGRQRSLSARQWPTSLRVVRAVRARRELGVFRVMSGVVIAALLHAAALEDKPMMWLLRDRRLSRDRRGSADGSAADARQWPGLLRGGRRADPRRPARRPQPRHHLLIRRSPGAGGRQAVAGRAGAGPLPPATAGLRGVRRDRLVPAALTWCH